MKLKTTCVIINYSDTTRYTWLKADPRQVMTAAGRNVACAAARIARKAYRLHYLRQGAELVGLAFIKSNGVRFEGQPCAGSHFYHYRVGNHLVEIHHVADGHDGNYCAVTLSDGRTERGSWVQLKPFPGL